MKFDPDKMCFGLSEELDRESFACFLWLSGQPAFTEVLSSRITSEEIDTHITAFMGLLKKYLTNDEYHRFFLLDENHHHTDTPRE
ncbi:MAG: hypothetical protein JRC87_04020 [Deltaproteobacteria bacterium]|nr:hypothetical protein [Deltaproteobacteria bacterium]